MLSGAMIRYISYADGDAEATGSIQSVEVYRATKLLERYMLHHDFDLAAEVMDTLTTRTYQIGELTMKCAREILLQEYYHDSEVFPDLLKLLKQQFTMTTLYKLENALEIIYLLLHRNRIEEAFQVIMKHISIDPYRSSPLFHGYAGLIAHMLWKREISSKSVSEAEHSSIINSDYCSTMLQQFDEMRKCIVGDGTGEYSSFLSIHIEALVELNELETALSVLDEYKTKQPQELNLYRLLIRVLLLSPQSPDNIRKLSTAREEIVKLDPSNPEVIPLVKSLLSEDGCDYLKCLSLLLNYLDYPVNRVSSTTAWTLLDTVKEAWPEYSKTREWNSRLKWWSKLEQS